MLLVSIPWFSASLEKRIVLPLNLISLSGRARCPGPRSALLMDWSASGGGDLDHVMLTSAPRKKAYIDLKDARSRLPDLMERAAQGEEIVIVEDDQSRVQLVATQEPSKKRIPEEILEAYPYLELDDIQAAQRWGALHP